MRDFHETLTSLDSTLTNFFSKSQISGILLPKLTEFQSRITPSVKVVKSTEKIPIFSEKDDEKVITSFKLKEFSEELVLTGEVLDRIKFGKLTEDDLIFWIILCWYVEHPATFEMRIELEKIIEQRTESLWILSLLYSKSNLLLWLLESDHFHSREFFGNVLNPKESIRRIKSLKFVFLSKKRPKRTIRHRGYRDKGTLPSLENNIRKSEQRKDVWLQEEQDRIEAHRQELLDVTDFLRGFFSG